MTCEWLLNDSYLSSWLMTWKWLTNDLQMTCKKIVGRYPKKFRMTYKWLLNDSWMTYEWRMNDLWMRIFKIFQKNWYTERMTCKWLTSKSAREVCVVWYVWCLKQWCLPIPFDLLRAREILKFWLWTKPIFAHSPTFVHTRLPNDWFCLLANRAWPFSPRLAISSQFLR